MRGVGQGCSLVLFALMIFKIYLMIGVLSIYTYIRTICRIYKFWWGGRGYCRLYVFVVVVHPPTPLPHPPHNKLRFFLRILPLLHVLLLNNNKQWALKEKRIVFKTGYIYIYSVYYYWGRGREIGLVIVVHQLDDV